MQTQLANNEEKLSNNIMFLYIFAVVVSGFGFVMIFLNGGKRVTGHLLYSTGNVPHRFEKPDAGHFYGIGNSSASFEPAKRDSQSSAARFFMW